MSMTPSANRNTYSVATLIIHIPRVEALRTSTLGYEIATPTELPGVRIIQHRSPIPAFPKEERKPQNHLKHSKNDLPSHWKRGAIVRYFNSRTRQKAMGE